MHFFKSKLFVKDNNTVLSLNSDTPKILYERIGDIEYYAVDLSGIDPKVFLQNQHPECRVEEVTYDSIRSIIEKSRIFSDLVNIKSKYNVDLFSKFGIPK